MTAPPKPWESSAVLNRTAMGTNYVDNRFLQTGPFPGMVDRIPQGRAPPPLPPRNQQQYSGFNSLASAFGPSAYMSPYSQFSGGMYSSPYSNMYSPFRNPYDSRFGSAGDEGPPSPFQSLESVVRAISSLSMMMESTYQSMYMSFRAVLGVADNMDRLRGIIVDLFGGVAIIRAVIWFCKKCLYLLGLIKNNPATERLWEAAAADVMSNANVASTSSRRTWPLIAFFSFMLGGPFLLYKIASPPTPPGGPLNWNPKTDGVRCVAVYDFNTNKPGELSFTKSEVLVRQRQAQSGWVFAMNRSGQRGYVPANRLKDLNSTHQKPRSLQTSPQTVPTVIENIPFPSASINQTTASADLKPVMTPVPTTGTDPSVEL